MTEARFTDKIALNVLIERLTKERDEAVAQVAVLCNIGDQIINRWWNADGIKTLTDEDANPLTNLRSALIIAGSDNVIHKARVLLNRLELAERKLEDGQFCKEGLWYCKDAEEMAMRLQRAEAVAEAAEAYISKKKYEWRGKEWLTLKQALAAWEERKG